MSALPPKADIHCGAANVRFGPLTTEVQRGKKRPYSITWSARARIVCGTFIPSAFAVCRLMASKNFVGNSIGKSAGLAPFRILSTKSAQRRYNASGSAV
jgi:hypothetical protein